MSYSNQTPKYKGLEIDVRKEIGQGSYIATFANYVTNGDMIMDRFAGYGRTKDEAIDDLIYWYENEDRKA